MKKRIVACMMAALMALGTMTGCGSTQASAAGSSASSEQRTVEDVREAGVLKVGAKSDTVNIGLINLNSKSSLSLEMKSRANNDTAVVKNEKFNIQMENVTLKFSCDMLIQCMQLLELRQETSDVVMRMGVVQAIEEIVMKLRMTSACERYQQSFLHYGLLQNVIVEWGNDG